MVAMVTQCSMELSLHAWTEDIVTNLIWQKSLGLLESVHRTTHFKTGVGYKQYCYILIKKYFVWDHASATLREYVKYLVDTAEFHMGKIKMHKARVTKWKSIWKYLYSSVFFLL